MVSGLPPGVFSQAVTPLNAGAGPQCRRVELPVSLMQLASAPVAVFVRDFHEHMDLRRPGYQ